MKKLNHSHKSPVVIIGKGPGTLGTTNNCPYTVCALNGAINICGRVDYWFANDYTAFGEFNPVKLLNVREGIILPEYLHLNTGGRHLIYYQDVIRGLTPGPYRVYTYNLHTSRTKNPDIPDFGKVTTVGETAVCWMLELGFKRFLLSGVGKRVGYEGKFAGLAQTRKSVGHFERAFKLVKKRVSDAGGTIGNWKGDAQTPPNL